MFVPIAPSYTNTRSASARRYGCVAADVAESDMRGTNENEPKRDRREGSRFSRGLTWPQFAGNRHEGQLDVLSIDSVRARPGQGRCSPPYHFLEHAPLGW